MIRNYFLFLLFVGLIIRILFIGNTGFLADISFWKSWSLAAVDHGIVEMIKTTNSNYPPGFNYVLWLMGVLYRLVGNPHDYYSYWKENNFAFLFISKSFAIAADMAIAVLIYWFVSQREKLRQLGANINGTMKPFDKSQDKQFNNETMKDKSSLEHWNIGTLEHYLPLILSAAFFLNPSVILDSALWGQVESVGILFTVAAILLIFYKHPLIGSAVFTIGFLLKLQNIIYIPIVFLFIYKYYDFPTMVKSIASMIFTFFLVNIPFVITNNMNQVLYLMTVNSDYFPWLSLNAQNLWWIVAGARGMQVTDKITILGMMNAKSLGLLIFSCCYLFSCILIFLRPTVRNFLLALTLAIYAFFLFTTQSHERYSYPVLVFLLLLYPFLETKIQVLHKFSFPYSLLPIPYYFWILFALFTLTVFFNMHYGLIVNYADNGMALLTRISTPQLSILNSYISIILYFLLLPLAFTQISILFFTTVLSLLGVGIFIKNIPIVMGNEISLTSYYPLIQEQDYGTFQINKSVDSRSGWKAWNRLSSSYFYYRKGFGTHAKSRLIFDINKNYRRFSVDYGINTEAPTFASVVFQIKGDGKELFASQKMGRFDLPQHTQIDIAGVELLELVATDAGDGINSDHADWYNPILIK